MNKLEQQIFDAQSEQLDWVEPRYMELIARIAAKIALELAERAYNVGSRDPEVDDTVSFEDFKQEIL